MISLFIIIVSSWLWWGCYGSFLINFYWSLVAVQCWVSFYCTEMNQQSVCVCVLVAQSCLTLWDPMDCSPPGSSVHGVLQARTLEWVDTPLSVGSSPPRDGTQICYILGWSFPSEPQGNMCACVCVCVCIHVYVCVYAHTYISPPFWMSFPFRTLQCIT